MKKIITLTALIALLGFSGCPKNSDAFTIASTTVTLARSGMVLAKTAMDAASAAQRVTCASALCAVKYPDKGTQYQTCMTEDHTADATFKQCYAKMATAEVAFSKASTVAMEAFNTADATINFVKSLKEQCKNQTTTTTTTTTEDPCDAWKKVDYMPLIKQCACMAYSVMSVIPGSAQTNPVYVLIMAGLKSYGCPATTK